MEQQTQATLVAIFGISSALGQELARRLLKLPHVSGLYGTYRHWHSALDELKVSRTPVVLRQLDMLDDEAVESFAQAASNEAARRNLRLTAIYCCGVWKCGALRSLDGAAFDAVFGVGLRAPFVLIASLLRFQVTPLRIIVVTGLGGERNLFESNGLFSICASAVQNLVKVTAAELSPSGSSCFAIALSLVDRGQPYMAAFERHAGVTVAKNFDRAVQMVAGAIEGPLDSMNGSVIELTDEVQDYRAIVQFLTGTDRPSCDERS